MCRVIPLAIFASDNFDSVYGRSIPDQMCAYHFVVFSAFKQSICINQSHQFPLPASHKAMRKIPNTTPQKNATSNQVQ